MSLAGTASTPPGVQVDEYAFVLYPEAWPELTVQANALAARYRGMRRPEAAAIVERAWSDARQAQVALAREMATTATKLLRESERKTRVRPDTEGGGGPRLGDYLIADVMPHQDLLPGSVGVANYDLLDAEVPWWVTNEIGNSTRVGEAIFGIFYGENDEAPPGEDMFREHPLFMPAPARAGGGPGTINNPIPERRFIEKALPEISRLWHIGFDVIHTRFLADVARAAVTFR